MSSILLRVPHLAACFFVLAAAAACRPSAGSNDVIEGVTNYTRVDATFACAGATPPEAVAGIKEMGFASIVNFREEGESGARLEEEADAADRAGIKYFHMPFRQPTPEIADRFLEVITAAENQPVYIHCGSANRVGAMWLIKRVKVDGWPIEKAVEEAERIGLRTPALKTFALEYVGVG
jgi:uncharacterized protein (TIGR01244 family)